jgi:glycosyltransferase involved in cell wall biosynthesis
MSITLSIIVPIYNVEHYLAKCLESILNQNFQNYELILVNDGSTDGSKKICEFYADKDSRIIVVDKINRGIGSARNCGLNIAKGDYITFVDSDDWLVDNALGEVMSAIINTNSDILIAGHYVLGDEYDVLEENIESESRFLNRVEALDLLLKDKDLRSYTWDKIFRTSLFNNVRFPEGRNFEDTATVFKLFNLSRRFFQINRAYYNYFRRKGSITRVYPKNIHKDYKNRLDNFSSFYERAEFTKVHLEFNYLNNLTARKAFNLGSQFIRFSIKNGLLIEGDINYVRQHLVSMDSNFLSFTQMLEKIFLIKFPITHLFFFEVFYFRFNKFKK